MGANEGSGAPSSAVKARSELSLSVWSGADQSLFWSDLPSQL